MADEKRLIDANALMNKLRRMPIFEKRDFDKHMLYVEKSIIDDMPTVDAVEVVRCADCIHYGTTKHGMRKCRIFTEMCGEGFFAPDADFYCGEGERRTE